MDYDLIAYKDMNHAPEGYSNKIIRHGLYKTNVPNVCGKQYFCAIDPQVSKTWIGAAKAKQLTKAFGYSLVPAKHPMCN